MGVTQTEADLKRSYAPLLAAALAIAPMPAFAALVFSTSATAPTADIITSNTTASFGLSTTANNGAGFKMANGQTFRAATDFVLDEIVIGRVVSAGQHLFQGLQFSLALYEFDNSSSVLPNGSAFHTATAVMPNTTLFNNFIRIDVDDQMLQANQQYGFVLTVDGVVPSGHQFVVEGGSGNPYADGRFVSTDGAGTFEPTANGDLDYQFWIVGDVVVPEPATGLLFLLGIGVAGLARRQRRA